MSLLLCDLFFSNCIVPVLYIYAAFYEDLFSVIGLHMFVNRNYVQTFYEHAIIQIEMGNIAQC